MKVRLLSLATGLSFFLFTATDDDCREEARFGMWAIFCTFARYYG